MNQKNDDDNDKDKKPDNNSAAYIRSVKEGLKVLKYSNEFRKSKGRSPMQVWNKDLHDLCLQHSKAMARVGRISHDGFRHRIGLMRKKGYRVGGAAENVAYNFGRNPARTAVDQWIKSPGHNKNLQANNNVQAASMFEKNGRKYFCQMFLNIRGYNKDNSDQTAKYGPK